MSPSQVLSLDGFGRDGVVTDTAPERLKASELAAARDMVLPGGIPTERGGWDEVGDLDPLGTSAGDLIGVMAVLFPGQSNFDLVVSDDPNAGTPTLGLATESGSGDVGAISATSWPVCVHRGEVIFAPRTGRNSMRRFARLLTGYTGGTGTISIAADATLLSGSSTNFDPHVPVGSFVGRGLHRVVSRTSDTAAAISDPADVAISGLTTDPAPTGYIGLGTLVTDKGTLTHTSSSTTVTGTGTTWNQAGEGFGAVNAGDWVIPAGDISQAMRVSAIGSDTSLTVEANSVGALTGVKYVIVRPAVGKVACSHENTLFMAGVDWNPGTLYEHPTGAGLGDRLNGRFGSTIQAEEAVRLFEIPVGSPDAGSPILALASSPWGLVVGKSDSVWRVTGQYPAHDVRPVAQVGVIDQRAMISVDDVVVFACREGIYAWQGGSLTDLTEGRRGEWVEKAADCNRCVIGMVRGHLFVSFDANGLNPECWVIDLRRGVHLGNFVSEVAEDGIESASFMHSARIPGEEDRLYFVAGDKLQVQEASTTIILPDGLNEVPDNNLGHLSVTTGSNLGGAVSRLFRATGVRVTYTCYGGEDGVGGEYDPGSISVNMKVPTVGFPLIETLDATPATVEDDPPPATVRLHAGNLIGRSGRSFQLRISRIEGVRSRKVTINALEVVVRQRRPRA